MNNVVLKDFSMHVRVYGKEKKGERLNYFFLRSPPSEFKKKVTNKKLFFSSFLLPMSLDTDDNHDGDILPFADCEFVTDVHVDLPVYQKTKKTKKKPIKQQQQSNEKDTNSRNTISYIYFENTEEENNFLTFIPYTGPSNTMHLGRRLYLPQLISNTSNDSTVSFQRFIRDYHRIMTTLEDMPLAIYIRFGISYILRLNPMLDKSISLKDFSIRRNRG